MTRVGWWDDVGARLGRARASVPRPWWWDGGVATIYVAIGLATTLVWPLSVTGGIHGEPLARAAAVVPLAALTVLRTHRPVWGLVAAVPFAAVDAVLGASLGGVLALADLLYCTVLHGPARAGAATLRGAVGGAVTLTVGAWLVAGDPRTAVGVGLASGGALVLPVLWAREVRRPVEEAAAERAAAAQAARIAELDRRAAVTDERTRLARDLHDSVAGHLSAIALQSQAALRADDAGRERVLHAVRENSVRALDEMRGLIEVLRADGDGDPATPAASRLAALPALVDSARAAGLGVEVIDTRPAGHELPVAVDVTAYRIAQEALTNAATHAPGAAVRVRVDAPDAGPLTLEVENTRTTARGHPGAGTGLEGMRVRAETVGGSLAAGPVDDGCWRVVACLPWGSR